LSGLRLRNCVFALKFLFERDDVVAFVGESLAEEIASLEVMGFQSIVLPMSEDDPRSKTLGQLETLARLAAPT
jgi:hypothetical protein